MRAAKAPGVILNQGKRSVTLNLRTAAGQALFLQLAAGVDVILEGNRPGTADRNGFGYQAVKQINERIIYCALSGYGATGPLSESAGYDLIFLGLSGLLRALTGNAGPPPVPQAYLADGISGLSAAYAVTVALFTRERTGGLGTFIDLAMLDSTFVSNGMRDGPTSQRGLTARRAHSYVKRFVRSPRTRGWRSWRLSISKSGGSTIPTRHSTILSCVTAG